MSYPEQNYQKLLNETFRSFYSGWAPPPDLTLSEWSDKYVYLSPESSHKPGKWETIPYQKGIMDAISDDETEYITFMKSARVGYTKIVNNTCGYYMHQDPCPIMIVNPTIEDAQGYSKDELATMLRDTPILHNIVSEPKSRDSSNTILKKVFSGGQLLLIGANSARGFRRVSIRVLLFDEIDGYPPTAGQEGDQIELGIRRTDYFWNRKIIRGSTPTAKGMSRIEDAYEESDKRRYYVPCPHCKKKQVLKFGNIDFSTKGTESNPVYICEHCSKSITYNYHRWMIENGDWRAEKEFKGHAGFHIWAAYSYAPNATWAKIVEAFLRAKRSNDNEKLKTVVNTIFGETWDYGSEEVDPNKIMARAENYGLVLPMESGIVTASVDVQDDHLEVLTKVWGRGEESWNIEHLRFYGDISKQDVWDTLDDFIQKTYEHESGARLRISGVGIDTGGHHTNEAYAFIKDREKRGVFALKGSNLPGKPIVSRPTKKNKGKVNLFNIGVFSGKDMFMDRLKNTIPGPRYIHYPNRFDKEFFEQLTSEKKIVKYRRGQGKYRSYYEWIKTKPKNEGLDLEVYNIATLYIICPDISRLDKYVDDLQEYKENKEMGRPSTVKKKGRRMLNGGIKI